LSREIEEEKGKGKMIESGIKERLRMD